MKIKKLTMPSIKEIHTLIVDFDGVLTNNKVYINESGKEFVACDRSDGLAFNFFNYFIKKNKLNIKCFILTKEKNKVVSARAKKIGIECFCGVDNKIAFIDLYLNNRFSKKLNFYPGVIYLGNDLNDLEAMEKVGFSVCPQDSHPLILQTSDLILPCSGGDGFFRMFIEKLLNFESMTKKEIYELVSNC
jgi:YrbI family 3-deoxy-D-manno-octulosonate 8-phosphate phosphatase